jgi:hypothetical protein
MLMRRLVLGGLLFVVPSVARAQQHGTGLIEDDPADIAATPEGDAPVRGEVPPRFDLSEAFPRPGSQGSLGTCVGWALSNVESFHEYEARAISLPSQGPAYSPLFIYAFARAASDVDCSGGLQILRALGVLRDRGVASIGLMPYADDRCNVAPDDAAIAEARANRIASWAKVNEHDAGELKSYLAARQPVIISMRTNDALVRLGPETYTGSSGEDGGGHAVVLVGYDDSRHAWKILNSWGPNWGDHGYGWIAYSAWNDLVRHAYVTERLADRPPEPPTPEPEPAPTPEPGPSPAPVVDRSQLDDDLRLGLDSEELGRAFGEYGAGVNASFVDSYAVDGAVRFNAVFRRNAPGYAWNWNATSETFSAQAEALQRQGLSIAGMRVLELPDGPRFLSYWARGSNMTTWSTNYQRAGFVALVDDRSARGWQPRSMSATATGGRDYFHVVWQPRRGQPEVLASWFDRSETYAATAARWRAAGFQATQVIPIVHGDRTYFHSLWRRQSEPTSWSLFDSARSFGSTSDGFVARGFSPATIEVTVQNNTPYFHSLWRRAGRSCAWNWNLDESHLRGFEARQRAQGRRISWLRTYVGTGWQRYVAVACRD